MILAAGLAQLPEKLGRSGVAASRAWQGLDHNAPNRHDTGSTTARSVDELALIRDTIRHYAPVLIAPLSIQIRRAGVQKKFVGPHLGSETPAEPTIPRLFDGSVSAAPALPTAKASALHEFRGSITRLRHLLLTLQE